MIVLFSLFQLERIYVFFGDTRLASIMYLIFVAITMLVNYYAIAYEKEYNSKASSSERYRKE